jgi:branched-chain amino acid transport system ATP-binding protein
MAILSLANVKKSFGPTEIIRGISLDIVEGEKHAIIGPNGAGKSTLFHIISGLYQPTAGEIALKGEAIAGLPPYEIVRKGLSRSFQVTNIFHRMTVYENIRVALLWSLGFRYSFWHFLNKEKKLNQKTEEVLAQIGLTDKQQHIAGELAYAELRALELGIAIASGADVILLDEPVAGMSRSEAAAAVELIKKITAGKTLVLVEHDMDIVFGIADRISVMVYGEIIATGTPQEVRNNPKVREAYLGEATKE